MARTEREFSKSPENGGLLRVDPGELMRDNPAALILHRESYASLSAHFSPDRFEPPQIVKVSTFSSGHGRVTRIFVVDGLTRTRFAAEHKRTGVPEAPGFKFDSILVKDVTTSLLQNPLIVPSTERTDDQKELKMLQYLRAVIPPTVEHSEIAPDRIASHLINGWDNMIGEDLSRKYSALAALSLLENSRVPTATDDMFKKFLGGQNELMAGETADERVRLQQALVEMASIIRQSKLIKEHVAQSAFALVSAASPVIGGEREARKQVYGLLHTPDVDRKLTEAYPEVGERERMRTQLGDLITFAFKKFADRRDGEEAITSLNDSLIDPSFTIDQVRSVFSSDKPVHTYSQIKTELNTQKVERYYRGTYRKDELSPLEAILISRIGGRRFVNDRELQNLARSISAAETMMSRGQSFLLRLDTERDELFQQGVRPQTLEEAVPLIRAAADDIANAHSSSDIARGITNLNNHLSEAERRFAGQITTKRVGEMVDLAFGDQLRTSRGSMIRRHAIIYIVREVDTSDNAAITKRLADVSGLDTELQSQVLNGDIRIGHALRLQRDRKTPRIPASPPSFHMAPQDLTPRAPSSPAGQEARVSPIAPIEIPTSPASISDDERALLDRQAAEVRRIELNNHNLDLAIAKMRGTIRDVDLSPDEIAPATKSRLDEMVREIGRLRFGHPNIVRVIQEEPRLLEELIQLRSAFLAREEVETSKDKRTGR